MDVLRVGSTTGGVVASTAGSPTTLVEAQPLNKIHETAIDPHTVADRTLLAVLIRPLCPLCYRKQTVAVVTNDDVAHAVIMPGESFAP